MTSWESRSTLAKAVICSPLLFAPLIFLYQFVYSSFEVNYIFPEDRTTVHSTRSSQISIPHSQLLAGAFKSHWSTRKLPYPEFLPPYEVRWRGQIHIPTTVKDPSDIKEQLHPGLVQRIYPRHDFLGSPFTQDIQQHILPPNQTQLLKDKMRAVEWVGLISINTAGSYRFLIDADTNSSLLIDGELVATNPRSTRNIRPLKKGVYRFQLRSQMNQDKKRIRVLWSADNQRYRPIPSSSFVTSSSKVGSELVIRSKLPYSISIDGEQVHAPGLTQTHSPHLLSSHPLTAGTHLLEFSVYGSKLPSSAHRGRNLVSLSLVDAQTGSSHLLESKKHISLLPIVLIILGTVAFLSACICAFEWIAKKQSDPSTWKARSYLLGIFLAITLGGFLLRFYQYDTVPFFLETADEFKVGWMGHNLIAQGQPRTWSRSDKSLTEPPIKYFGDSFDITSTKLHPGPIYGLLLGAVTHARGSSDMFDVLLADIRLVSIVCTTLCILLICLLATDVYGRNVGIMAGMLYATLPQAVLTGRLSKEENLLTLLVLLTLYLVRLYSKTENRIYWLLSVGLSVLCLLTKEVGFCVGPFLIIAFWKQGGWRLAAQTGILWGILSLSYPFYAWLISWDAFLKELQWGSNLGSKLATSSQLIRRSTIVTKEFGSLSYIFLWCCCLLPVFRRKWLLGGALATLFVGTSLLVLQHFDYGWYRIPLYPFLCIAGGVLLSKFAKRPDLFTATMILICLLLPYLQRLAPSYLFTTSWTIRLFVMALLVPFALSTAVRTRATDTLSHSVANAMVYGVFAVNLVVVLNYLAF